MAYRSRRSTDEITPALAAVMIVTFLVCICGMAIVASVTTPLIPAGLTVAICVVGAAVSIFAIVVAVMKARAEKAKYLQVGGPVLSWQAAEQMAANHMRAYGFADARRTPKGADGGLDVVSRWGVAQVKYFSKPVGRPDVQRLRGAAHGHERVLFYALTGFNTNAVQFADGAGIALFQYDQRGMVWPVNGLAKTYRRPEQAHA